MQTLFVRDPPGGEEGIGVADLHDAIDDAPVEGLRPEVLADALDEVRASGPTRVHGARRIGADDLYRRVARLQRATHTGDRASGADTGDEVRDPAARLLPDLGAGRLLVRQGVRGVRVLVGTERAGCLTNEALGGGVVGARVFERHRGGTHDDLGAVRPEQGDLLVAHLVAHHEDAVVAALGRDNGEAGAGVARSRLDDGSARRQQPVALGRVDHGDRDAVLDAPTRVHRLDLGQQRATQALGFAQAPQPHQRRVPDEVENRFGVVHRFGLVGRHRASA